jgi:hypothetical protein
MALGTVVRIADEMRAKHGATAANVAEQCALTSEDERTADAWRRVVLVIREMERED